jgi:predicted RNA methylase
MYDWLLILAVILIVPFVKLATQQSIFIPLPMSTVKKILTNAKIKENDVLYDLGSGDGRIIVTVAKNYGIKAVGFEKNRILAWITKIKIKRSKLNDKVKIVNGNFFKQNLSNANIIVLYLTQKLNDKIQPKLERELKKGTRVISASHIFKGWKEYKKVKTGHFYTYFYKI